MTLDVPAAPAPPRARVRARWRQWRWLVAIGAVVLLGALVGALLVPRGAGGRLDPENPAPDGTRAAAQILGGQGVEVTTIGRTTEAAALAGPDATLVVVDGQVLGEEQLTRLARLGWGAVVLVSPTQPVLDALAPGLRADGREPGEVRSPRCDLPAAVEAGDVLAGGSLYRARDGAGAQICYEEPGVAGAGMYAVDRSGGRPVFAVGQWRMLTNQRLADDGNAALTLTTLGTQPRLVWLMSDPLEAGSGPAPSLAELLPPWVGWVATQAALAALVALFWRGRRLGRLVEEPLPVVVRAAETEEGRARLYQQAGARGRAAATLRTAALRRLARRLAIPAGTAPEQVCTLVAEAAGAPDTRVRALLLGPPPANDTELVELADTLDTLERDVAARSGPANHSEGNPTS